MDAEIAKIDAELKNLKQPKSKWDQSKGKDKVKQNDTKDINDELAKIDAELERVWKEEEKKE